MKNVRRLTHRWHSTIVRPEQKWCHAGRCQSGRIMRASVLVFHCRGKKVHQMENSQEEKSSSNRCGQTQDRI